MSSCVGEGEGGRGRGRGREREREGGKSRQVEAVPILHFWGPYANCGVGWGGDENG